MARGRLLSRSIVVDKKVHELSSDTCRLAWSWLIAFIDREGRFYGDASVVKSNVMPRRADVTAEMFEGFIQEWVNKKMVMRYEIEGELYLWFPNFSKHQPNLRKDREASSELPAPTPEQLRKFSDTTPELRRSESGLTEVNRTEVNETEQKIIRDENLTAEEKRLKLLKEINEAKTRYREKTKTNMLQKHEETAIGELVILYGAEQYLWAEEQAAKKGKYYIATIEEELRREGKKL